MLSIKCLPLLIMNIITLLDVNRRAMLSVRPTTKSKQRESIICHQDEAQRASSGMLFLFALPTRSRTAPGADFPKRRQPAPVSAA